VIRFLASLIAFAMSVFPTQSSAKTLSSTDGEGVTRSWGYDVQRNVSFEGLDASSNPPVSA